MSTEVEITRWNKAVADMSKEDLIRFQFMVYCHMEKTPNISNALLECLTVLGVMGTAELKPFCELLTSKEIFRSVQSSRNAVIRLQDKGLIIKDPRNKKMLCVDPKIKIQNKGNVLVEIKFLSLDK